MKSGCPLSVSQESGIADDQKSGCPTRVTLRGKRAPIHPHSARHLRPHSARLGFGLSQLARTQAPLARSCSCAARRGGSGPRWIYTCTRDIIAASSRHAALVRSGSPRALLPSFCGRGRERKKRDAAREREKERLEERSEEVLAHLRSSAQNRRQD